MAQDKDAQEEAIEALGLPLLLALLQGNAGISVLPVDGQSLSRGFTIRLLGAPPNGPQT